MTRFPPLPWGPSPSPVCVETWTFLCKDPQAQYEEVVSSCAWVWGTEHEEDFFDPVELWGLQEAEQGVPNLQDGGSEGDLACQVEGAGDLDGSLKDCV